ncbi:MAG: hypothetical protein ABIH78_04035 [Candidatus Peregrinibacteria bacterium]
MSEIITEREQRFLSSTETGKNVLTAIRFINQRLVKAASRSEVVQIAQDSNHQIREILGGKEKLSNEELKIRDFAYGIITKIAAQVLANLAQPTYLATSSDTSQR